MDKFNKLYNEIINEDTKFNNAVMDVNPTTVVDIQQSVKKLAELEQIVKKINGVTRRGKCMRDLHDKCIQKRDNDVQLTAVELEESLLDLTIDVPRMIKAANAMIKADKTLKKEIPPPLEIEEFSNKHKLNLTPDEIDYLYDEWSAFVDGKVK